MELRRPPVTPAFEKQLRNKLHAAFQLSSSDIQTLKSRLEALESRLNRTEAAVHDR